MCLGELVLYLKLVNSEICHSYVLIIGEVRYNIVWHICYLAVIAKKRDEDLDGYQFLVA
jgi:hypothetical protein